MYKLTEEQARAYVYAGFFPRPEDVDAIVDLQDAFGHLSVHFVEQMLDDLDTAENAERLYRLIWADEDVDAMVQQSKNRKNQTFKREVLRAKLMRAKNNALTRNAIRSQVVVELEDRIDREIIESYDHLSVTASTTDPTVCVVEFEFTVVHGLNRSYLTAHLSG